jgi:hypothetical protein
VALAIPDLVGWLTRQVSHLDEDGRLKPTEAMEASATAMLDELLRCTQSMRSLRA